MLSEDPEQNAVIFFSAGGREICMPCLALPPDQMLSLLQQAVRERAIPKPDWLAIVTDTYSLTTPSEELLAEMRRGLLGELFQAGDPRVTESILAVCIAPDGPTWSKQQNYTKAAGKIVWDEPFDLPPDDMGGDIANGMRRVLGMEAVRT
jgi:hypothetical protein